MQIRWNKQRRSEHEPPTPPTPPPTDTAVDGDTDSGPHEQAEATATVRHIAEHWSALSADDRADIVAAVTEQQQLMDDHGITDFHGCTRGDVGTTRPPIRDAATIRTETEQLRALLAAKPAPDGHT